MGPIIISLFKKYPIPWELIHLHLLHPYESFMKEMYHHLTLTGLPNHFPKNINELPCTVFFTAKMTISPKDKTVETTNLRPGELLHMEFALQNVAYTQGFTSMITVLHVKTTTVWILPTASKQPPIRIILFMLTTLNDENHTCRHVRVNEDGALEKPADVTNLIVEKFSI